jgi:DNA (cytosine-5)-methyltransferase 1
LRNAAPLLEPDGLRSLELFGGAGGFALGLSRAGFKPAAVVDWDKVAIETLKANGRNGRRHTEGWPVKCQDVRTLTYDGVGQIDLLSAGAPCQPFSRAGLLLGENDARNMFSEVVRAVRDVRPRAFVLENVRGLLFERNAEYFEYLIAQLRVPSLVAQQDWTRRSHVAQLRGRAAGTLEYRVEWRLVDAADFGAPQHRVRLVVVGTRADQAEFEWPDATHSRDALLQALRGDLYWEEHRIGAAIRERVRRRLPETGLTTRGERWRTARDVMKALGRPARKPTSEDYSHVSVPGARLYSKHTGSTLDWPVKTIKAGVHGCPGGEHIVVRDNGTHRYFTVRECAMIQGFPSDYLLPNVRSQAMRVLGNAVPVPLAEALGGSLARVLRHYEVDARRAGHEA